MSKTFRSILPVLAALLVILQSFNGSTAQDLEIAISIDAAQPSIIVLEGKRTRGSQKHLSFVNSIAGHRFRDDRVSDVQLFDSEGNPVSFKRFAPGEYVAENNFSRWSYRVDLPDDRAAGAHASWILNDAGVLMLADLLPQFADGDSIRSANVMFPGSYRICFGVRAWQIDCWEPGTPSVPYALAELKDSVLYVGGGWRSIALSGDSTSTLLLRGDTSFGIKAASLMADEVNSEYRRLFGSIRSGISVGISRRNNAQVTGEWEADTRGSNVTILYSEMPFQSQSLQRLHEQLRHEMFHLWIPEGVNLTGNYDWFYEGFALYQSLKLGVAVNRLRFEDYLDSLTQAYAIDRRLGGKVSLIDASKNRWSGDNNSVVYARGMLVAFLADMAMLEASKGKRSTDDIVREVYQKHSGTAARQDGNSAVIAIMKQWPELVPIIERYVTGSEKLDWTPFLSAAGLEATGANRTALTTVAKPNGRQKKLLDKLGYNNWRKLSSTRK